MFELPSSIVGCRRAVANGSTPPNTRTGYLPDPITSAALTAFGSPDILRGSGSFAEFLDEL
jgi:hypothetical protein